MTQSPHILDLKKVQSLERPFVSAFLEPAIAPALPRKVRAKGSRRISKSIYWSLSVWLLYIAFVAGLVWGLPSFLSWKLGSEYPIAAITSGSMWPELSRGDLVLIEAVAPEDIRKGDIVVWRAPQGGFVIHRVVKTSESGVVTKGDGNFKEDPAVSYDQIVGKALTKGGKAMHLPYLGYTSIIGSSLRDKIKS